MSPMLSEADVRTLLGALCVDLGFCLTPSEIERLASDPPTDVIAFTNEVFRVEGPDPLLADRHVYRQLRAAVAVAFGRATSPTGLDG